MDVFVAILVVAAIVAGLYFFIQTGSRARETTSLTTMHSPEETVVIVKSAFNGSSGMLWTDDNGPGTVNMRRRGKDGGITISIAIDPAPGGGSSVSMWASKFNVYFIFLVNFAGAVNSKKKAIASRLVG